MKKATLIIFILLTALFLFMFMDSLAYLFPYHEQQSLFLFSGDYAENYFSQTGKAGEYMAHFLTSLFYWPVAGKILFSVLLSLTFLLPSLACYRIAGRWDPLFLSILVPLCLFVQFESADFEISRVTGLLTGLSLVFIASLFPKKIFYALLLPLLLVSGLGMGWIYPVITVAIQALSILSALLSARFAGHKKRRVAGSLISLCIYAAGCFYSFVMLYNMRERLLIEAELHLQNQKWEDVILCSEKYRGDNQLMEYFRNIALYQTGRMPYDLFRYKQSFGINSLFLSWTGNPHLSRYGHYIYEQLGYLNEAHRWAFEAMVVYGETAPTLINLIRYNIANGRPEVAMRFIRKLKQSLFYRKQAAEYERIAYTGEVPGLQPVRHNETERVHFANIQDIGPELLFICEQEPENRMAFEYLMSYLLLSNRLKQFAGNLPRMKAFSYPEMPVLYQEALERYKQTSK